MTNIKYYPEDELVRKYRVENTAGSIISITTHRNGRKSTQSSVKKEIL